MRRKHLAALAVFAIVIVTWGCKHANAEVQDTDSGTATGKTLVVYFSHQVPYEVDGVTGASYAPVDTGYASSTEYFATYIQKQTGADLFRITFVEGHYPATYEPLAEAAKQEHDNHVLPKLMSHIDNMDDYSTIIIGYPIWWYDMPMPVYSFFEEYDLSRKRIAVFTTHLGSGLSGTIPMVKRLEPEADVVEEGFSCNGNQVTGKEEEVNGWLKKMGY